LDEVASGIRIRIMWHELAIAFCLMLVIEGILPFIAPGRWRRMLMMLDQIDDATMRWIGLASMLTGTVLLLIIN
jgi:uncharacterized protein YjeT (DUF2065 family)